MRIFAVTVCHVLPEIAAFSLTKALRTGGTMISELSPLNWVVVQNHWPIQKEKTAEIIRDTIAPMLMARVLEPQKNVGGHGGFNLALERIRLFAEPDDLILCYDPDSNPITQGWFDAMVEVMLADPSLPYVSLMHTDWVEGRGWSFREVSGKKLAYRETAEAMNVTLYRNGAIPNGMRAPNAHYGGIEARFFADGIKGAYLYDFRETYCPIPHPQEYIDWKGAHGGGRDKRNFDQYIREIGN